MVTSISSDRCSVCGNGSCAIKNGRRCSVPPSTQRTLGRMRQQLGRDWLLGWLMTRKKKEVNGESDWEVSLGKDVREFEKDPGGCGSC